MKNLTNIVAFILAVCIAIAGVCIIVSIYARIVARLTGLQYISYTCVLVIVSVAYFTPLMLIAKDELRSK